MSSTDAVERGPASSPLHRLVAAILALGAAAGLALAWAARGHGTDAATWTAASPGQRLLLLGLLLVLACVAEVAYVRVKHGDSTEDLTFFEAVLVAGALLLPPLGTFAVSLGGLLIACLVMRRPLTKTLFNLGCYAVGTAAFVGTTLLAAEHGPFTIPSIAALLVGTALFAAVNLLALAQVLFVTEGLSRRDLLRHEWPLSAVMTFSQVGLGSVTVAVAVKTPALLPFTVLPALACLYAYRMVADRAREVERGHGLATLGSLMASGQHREDFLPATLDVLRRVFASDAALLVIPDGEMLAHCTSGPTTGRWSVPATLHSRTRSPEPQAVQVDELPPGWQHGLAVGVDLGAQGRGVLVLGWARATRSAGTRPWARGRNPIDDVDEALLRTVTPAIAASLRAGQHLTRLLEETSKLKTVVEHSSDGIVVLDRDGHVLVWSPAMQRMTGVDADEVTELLDRAAARPAARPDTALQGPDPVAALLYGLADQAGSPTGLPSALHADPAQAHAQLHLTLGTSEETARELQVSVARTQESAGGWRLAILTVHDVTRERRVDRLKSDFIATVSHELRTPITPIKGYARMLATKGEAVDPARRLKALRLIEDRADHLARLVDDLLLASRVSGGNAKFVVETSRHDLDELVGRAVDSFPHLADRLSVHLAGMRLPVDVDSVRVVQCLSNLLSNAEKYSPAGSPVSIEVDPPREARDACRVTVVDHGRGIAPAELEHVFERFYRVEDAFTMRTGGSGLGLFIARELARAMNGEITASSVLGAGSRFTLELPLAELPLEAALPASAGAV